MGRSAAETARDLVRLARPQQWYKNLLLFVGLVFALHLDEPDAARLAASGFLVFCLASSGVYAWNDVLDAPRDRLHPRKASRPVASRRVSVATAGVLGTALLLASVVSAAALGRPFLAVLVAYLAVQAAYLLSLRHHVFLDLFALATGLVLRAAAGVVVLGVALSPWLVLCTFFLALVLGLGKRRSELGELGESAPTHRESLRQYDAWVLDQSTAVVTSALVASYSLYAFFHGDPLMMLTVPPALYGVLRYLLLAHQGKLTEGPQGVFRDLPSVVSFVLWSFLVVAVLYADLAPWTVSGG